MILTRLSLCVLISMVLELYDHSVGKQFLKNCHEYTIHNFNNLTRQQHHDWRQSQDNCSKNGGHLVCIEHEEELDFLVHKLEGLKMAGKSEYFIGLQNQSSGWTWICNTNISVTPRKFPWHPSQPSGNGHCAKMYFDTKRVPGYQDIPCEHYDLEMYICERRISSCKETDDKKSTKPTTIHTLPAPIIATYSTITNTQRHHGGGKHFLKRCREYTIHNFKNLTRQQHLDWRQSQDNCSKNGGHLVCIEHEEELDFLVHKLEGLKLARDSEYFIGLQKQSSGWTWICNANISVTPERFPWHPSQPSGNGNCAKLYFDKKRGPVYDDIPCEHYALEMYICERRISSCHEIDVDECVPNPCANGGSCVDGVNNYSCICRVGYTGDLCETDIDDCLLNACANGESCVDGVNSYSCICPVGYTGDLCETDIDECSANSHSCDINATCSNTKGSYLCTCKSGYSGNGKACSEIDECNGKTCIPSASECRNYSSLSSLDRNINSYGISKCDYGIGPGWFRFQGAAGTRMPTSCPPARVCSTSAPGWLNGEHPSVADGQVSRTVCFHYFAKCCELSTTVKVRNCRSFYVYYLDGVPICSLRYCGTV
ncbi:uncharacterized protein [Montipora capricornis]|uniref:uncharacterized protein isoform X2 n=1 Tax=Montipora capricornis TaxID=246305 RepID=UPI0035F192A7